MRFAIDDTLAAKISAIKLVGFDADGVLTDNRLIYDQAGNEFKAFHARDGLGIKLLQRHGFIPFVLSGRQSKALQARCQELQIEHVFTGQLDKRTCLSELQAKLKIKPEATAFMGDDWIDLPIQSHCALLAAPADADLELLARADWTAPSDGGRGAVRDLCHLLLYGRGVYQEALNHFIAPASSCANS